MRYRATLLVGALMAASACARAKAPRAPASSPVVAAPAEPLVVGQGDFRFPMSGWSRDAIRALCVELRGTPTDEARATSCEARSGIDWTCMFDEDPASAFACRTSFARIDPRAAHFGLATAFGPEQPLRPTKVDGSLAEWRQGDMLISLVAVGNGATTVVTRRVRLAWPSPSSRVPWLHNPWEIDSTVKGPRDLDAALDDLDRRFTKEQRNQLLGDPLMQTDLQDWIRVQWSQHPDRLLKSLADVGLRYDDDMSAFVVEMYLRRVRGDALRLREEARRMTQASNEEARPKDSRCANDGTSLQIHENAKGFVARCERGHLWVWRQRHGWLRGDAAAKKRWDSAQRAAEQWHEENCPPGTPLCAR